MRLNEIRETTVVFNGDILTDANISEIIEFHRQKKAEATIVLTPVENPSAYGLGRNRRRKSRFALFGKAETGRIIGLKTNNINAGIYILEPEVLDMIPEGENYSFEYNVFPELLKRQKDFYAYVLKNNYWRDIGSPTSYLDAHHDFLNNRIKDYKIERQNDSEVATAAFIDKNSVIGENCIIKPNAKIINSVIGEGVHIEEKAVIENSVIWAHTRISRAAAH